MTGTPTRYVVLLRGVNLGRTRQVDMARLREVLSARGHTDVRTHLRSGNAVLSSALAEPELVEDVAAAMRQEFGFDVQVVVRTGRELAEVVAADPLGAVATDPARYLVTFLPRPADPARPTPPGWPPCPGPSSASTGWSAGSSTSGFRRASRRPRWRPGRGTTCSASRARRGTGTPSDGSRNWRRDPPG